MKNNSTNKAKGSYGEDVAEKYLLKKGYTIIQRNYTSGKAEIDIIAEYQNNLVFVEVKMRYNAMVEPERAVTKSKQKHLALAASAFLEKNTSYQQARFDILTINIVDKAHEIVHFEDAFYPFITL